MEKEIKITERQTGNSSVKTISFKGIDDDA